MFNKYTNHLIECNFNSSLCCLFFKIIFFCVRFLKIIKISNVNYIVRLTKKSHTIYWVIHTEYSKSKKSNLFLLNLI